MNFQDTNHPHPILRRIVGAALRRRRLVSLLAITLIVSTVASFISIVGFILKILLSVLLVQFLIFISFRGEYLQALTEKFLRYFSPQLPNPLVPKPDL
jgi:hypothetical protein